MGCHFFHTYTPHHTCFRVHSPCSCFYTLQADVTFPNFRIFIDLIFFMSTLSKQIFGLHSPSTCKVSFFSHFHRNSFSILLLSIQILGFTLHIVILLTLSKQTLHFKILVFSLISFFSCLHSQHMFKWSLSKLFLPTLSKRMFGLHSQSICGFFTGFYFPCFHSPYRFKCSLSIQLFCLHSPSRCYISKFQFFYWFLFFLPTHSSRVLVITLPFSGFHRISFFSCLHSPGMFKF